MPLQMRYFLETLGPTMGGLSHSCCLWYKKRQTLQKKKMFLTHSFAVVHRPSHTDTSHTMRRHGILWTGCTDQQGKCPPISLRINGLLRNRSSFSRELLYTQTYFFHCTLRCTEFNPCRWNLLKILFNIVLLFTSRSSNKF